MARLEYRLIDEWGRESVLYYYHEMKKTEISARLACDYFIKDREVYERTSTYMEDDLFILYVQRAADEGVVEGDPVYSAKRRVYVEIREYQDWRNRYPLVHLFPMERMEEVVPILQCDLLYIQDKQWEKTSIEIDEDRGTFVYYAKPLPMPLKGEGHHE